MDKCCEQEADSPSVAIFGTLALLDTQGLLSQAGQCLYFLRKLRGLHAAQSVRQNCCLAKEQLFQQVDADDARVVVAVQLAKLTEGAHPAFSLYFQISTSHA